MKRKDLKVGDELFYQKGKNWAPVKATVLATEPYVGENVPWRPNNFWRVPRGINVLVSLDPENAPSDLRREAGMVMLAVPLVSLKGPWDELSRSREQERERLNNAQQSLADEMNRVLGRAGVGCRLYASNLRGISSIDALIAIEEGLSYSLLADEADADIWEAKP